MLESVISSARPLPLLALAVATLTSLAPPPVAEAQSPAADRLYREALRIESEGNLGGAIEEMLLVVQQFPDDEITPRALLRVAELRDASGDNLGAARALEKLLDGYPRTREAAAGFLLQGRAAVAAARNTSDLAEARSIFRRIPLLYGAESFPEIEERSEARVRSGEISLQLGDPETAAPEFLAAIEDEAPSVWTGRARRLLADAWLRTGDWSSAAEILQTLAESPVEGPEASADPAERDRARRWLTMIHRHYIRPQTGERRWTSSGRFPASGLVLREPVGVAAADDGRVLLVDEKDEQAILLDADGQVVGRKNLDEPGRPGWADDVPFVAADHQLVLPFDGQRTQFLEPRSQRESPLDGMRVAERGLFGHWYVLAKGWDSLLAYESTRVGQELLAKNRPDFEDLALDHQRRLLLLDRKAGQVGRLGHDRRWEGAVVQGDWRRPEALATDLLGNLYVLDRGRKVLEVFSAEGKLLDRLGPSLGSGIELDNPRDVTVDGSGRILIADDGLPFLVVLD